ncbi:tetratricopeptide repeat protein [Cellulophaga baltica]|uniref:tetratricopeptide repeat protein n=1 Tax=Cellulophaga TaxID=104264 RepID=UPI001C077F45|nr:MULTISPECIES: tetratricopeptide repeat protein [Cellulophaga]MBU2995740.1 tetratricopeptide repeat protein [Cellulophaga baltica]MDO6767134.1 tetratricopeptide repeat protein [Cellulophaga sp. 1_MG-2023]
MKNIVSVLLLLVASFTNAQQTKEEQEEQRLKELQESKNYTWDGNKALSEKDFVNAEADYRKAISLSNENAVAPYNLGNAYYLNETYNEAFSRYKQAGELATSKVEKHKAYHNMGNVFMKEKQYEKAVEAYKQALRNDPKDEETRYNLALAQEMLKKQQEEDQKNQDQNQDNKDQENKDDQKDENEENKDGEGEDKEGDKGDEKEEDKKDKGDEGDKGDEKEEDKKDGEGDKKEDKKDKGDKPEDGKGEGKPEQRPSQLSPQQVQNLLEAMQNEEKKVQEKMDAKKVKGVKTKNEKDW